MEELTHVVDHDAGPVLLSSQSFKHAIGSVSSIVRDTSLRDPLSDPERPRAIAFNDVQAAESVIASGNIYTPCEQSRLSDMLGMEAYFKMDFLQVTGSIKDRGARYALSVLEEPRRRSGVVTASLGNHALAMSYHGNQMGIPVTVVMPVTAPLMKITRCRSYNANVIVRGRDVREARMVALKLAKTNGYTYIDSLDNPHIMAGQGTLGLEIVNQVADANAVVVPVGSGGLLAGVATAIKSLNPKIRVLGVESERCSSFSTSMRAGRPTAVEIQSTLAESLAVPLIGSNSFATARPLVDRMIVVNEDSIATAMLHMFEAEKCVVEGAGAVALAAAIGGQLDEFKNKKVVFVVSGGNIDTSIIGRCLERGLTAEGRLVRFRVAVVDRPGAMSELTRLICSIGASIKDLTQERTWVRDDVFSVRMSCVCETRNKEHSVELQKLIRSNYPDTRFADSPFKDECGSDKDEALSRRSSTEI